MIAWLSEATRRRRLADLVVAHVDEQRDAWRRNAIANVVTSITAGDCVAQRPEDEPVHRAARGATTTAKHMTMLRPGRPVGLDVNASVYAPAMIELPVGEVDEPQDAEDEPDADRHQRVDRAEPDRVDERLGVERRDERRRAHER